MARGRNQLHSAQGGFTLIELSIALFVVTVGLLGIVQLYHYGLSRGRSVNEAALARQAVQNEIETLRALPFDSLQPGAGQPFASDTAQLSALAHPKATTYVAPVPGHETDLVEVTARVTWRGDRGREIQQQATTYIARRSGGGS